MALHGISLSAAEAELLLAIHRQCTPLGAFRPATVTFPRSVAPSVISEHGHVSRILRKWVARGWFDFATHLDLGWLTLAGQRVAEQLGADDLEKPDEKASEVSRRTG